jgi:hypothetical protein
MDKISLGANYYHSRPLTGSSDDDDVFQLDLLIKF